MTTDSELYQRYQAVLPSFVHPFFDEPISIDRGEGGYVFDLDGNRYLDFFGGVLTTMIGHSHPEVVAAVQAQAAKMMHTSTLYLSEPMIELAEQIAGLSGIPDARVCFTTSGTEANDTALLLATSYRKSNQILAMRNSYHGRSFTAQAITCHRSWSSTSISGLDVNFVQGGYRLRSPFRDLDDDGFTRAAADDLIQVLDMMTSGDVAGLIAEPIQGVGGFAMPPDGFFGSMHKVLSESGILFISDEVQTGWGRTGEHFWGYQAHDIVPDMLTFAKGVGNGITLAGCVARAEIMDTIDVLSFSTFGGNPLSAAAGSATIRAVLDENLQDNALKMGRRLVDGADPGRRRRRLDRRAARRRSHAGHRNRAARSITPTAGPAPDAARSGQLLEACRRRGLLIGKGGLYGNVLRIAPMLNVTEAEIDEGAAALVDAIEEVSRG